MENQDIAIVGISVFCPAGDSVDEFWHGIAQGGDFITEAPDDVIAAEYFHGTPNGVDRFYCSRGGFSKAFKLDPIRYGIMPIVAGETDVDQLVSMAGADMALRDAGVFEKGISLQNCGIIIGKGNFAGIVQLRSLQIIDTARQMIALLKIAMPELTDEDLEKVKRAYQAKQGRYMPDIAIGTMPNLVASLVANRFDMHGPAYTVDAACASGIVAINHSISLLRSGQCDIAVAGGMHTGHSAMFWGAFDLLGAMSRKQVIAPFSEDADGLLIGQGCGFIVLKTLKKALEDDDRIYAVIKEAAVCSDGASSHVTVPSVDGQMRALEQAWKKSGMDPKKIGYIEAHGTGTIVGDRTELTTLKNFFGDNTYPPAYVGSVKSNIGHTMPAAGMIGIIKAALALHWRKIPPTLHCERPLPAMRESRFLPPQALIDWDGERLPLIAGVNAFGFGGINAHAIMTAYEPEAGVLRKRPRPYLGEALAVSAHSGSLMVEKLIKGDYTDTGGNYRLVIFDPNETRVNQAIAVVNGDKPWLGGTDIWFTNRPLLLQGGKIVFLFPGFNLEWNSETDSLSDILDLPRLDGLISGHANGSQVSATALRAHYIEWLCKAGLEKLGIEADMYAGYSIGEWAAAIFAGISEGDPNELLGKLADWWAVKRHPMVAVSGVSRAAAEAWCEKIGNIWLACDNCPSQIMICGEEKSMEALLKILDGEHVLYSYLPYGSGWHTPLAATELTLDRSFFDNVQIREGRVPVWSATTLGLIPSNKRQYVELVCDQMTKPVYFRDLVQKLYDGQQARIFIQIGLGSLTGFVEDILKGKEFGAISASVTIRGGADQLRRVMALLFIEGRHVNADFLGVKPLYRAEHNLLTLRTGVPPIITELPELNEAVNKRYGAAGLAPGISAGLSDTHANPIAAAINKNMRSAAAVQREVARLFDTRQPAAGARAPFQAVKPAVNESVEPRVGGKFEEAIRLTFEDCPYLVDHCIVRQPLNWPFAEDLNPVVPLTMTLEIFAEMAMKRAPGKKLVSFRNVAAYKWIILDKPFEASVKGEWVDNGVLKLELGENAKAECVFADAWPEPPAEFAGEIDIGEIITEDVPGSELYDKYSFHGPLYHSLIHQKKICTRGMVCVAEKQGGKGSLIDIIGQQLGTYLHVTQIVNTISFPVRIKELTFFTDLFDQGGAFEHTLMINRLTDNIAAGDMVLKRGGSIWCVARDCIVQRFANDPLMWNVIRIPQYNKLAEEIARGVYYYSFNFQENVLFLLTIRYLNGLERKEYESLGSRKQKHEHIVSRIALKDAVRSFVSGGGGEMLYPIEIYCDHDKNGRPKIHGYGRAAGQVDSLCVSLAHKGNSAAAIVANAPVGIDLEKIEAKEESFLNVSFTDREIELIKEANRTETAIRFWVAKEACAKKAGIGLCDPKRYEVKAIEGDVLIVGNERVQTAKVGTEHIVGWTV